MNNQFIDFANKIIDFLKPRTEAELGEKIIAKVRLIFLTRREQLRLPARERIIFIKRLAILIKAEIPITIALDMLARQSGSTGQKRLIESLRAKVETGLCLAAAMDAYREIFGSFAINIVSVGEASGTLIQNLNYLADELQKRRELKRNIVGALVYPVFILVATIGIVVLLIGYVFPKILPIFLSLKTGLPWSTRMLIAAGEFMQEFWIYILAAVIFAAALLPFLFKKRPVALFFDRSLLHLPLIGTISKSYHIANFSRTLGLLLKSEVGIIQALEITGRTSGSLNYRAAFENIIAASKRGGSIGESMEKEKFLFPALVSQMVAVGEASGNLSSSLIYLSQIYEDEMNNATKNLSVAIEPALMIFMGVLVGFVAISIITPIYGITRNLQ